MEAAPCMAAMRDWTWPVVHPAMLVHWGSRCSMWKPQSERARLSHDVVPEPWVGLAALDALSAWGAWQACDASCGLGQRRRARDTLVKVGFSLELLPSGGWVDAATSTLSGGWRMKLALARAMLQDADVLLMTTEVFRNMLLQAFKSASSV